MQIIDRTKPVIITGGTGYVGSQVVARFLEEGLTVHAAVRHPENRNSVRHLDELAKRSPGKIRFFKADLLAPGTYDEAMAGCELVIHSASPFLLHVKDPQKELVEPALKGTKNVLGSVNRTSSVKRVVLTSSVAAIIGDAKDCLAFPNGSATEENWNTSSSLMHQPYSYSKTVAEQMAWEICRAQSRWDLVTINPSFVMGPAIVLSSASESLATVRQFGNGRMKQGAPDFAIGVVDVRDVAEAHFRAAFTPEASGRYIVSAENTDFITLAGYLRQAFGNTYPFPSRVLPKWLVWLAAPAAGFSRKMARLNLGYPWKADNSKSIRELGMTYRSADESVTALFRQLAESKSI